MTFTPLADLIGRTAKVERARFMSDNAYYTRRLGTSLVRATPESLRSRKTDEHISPTGEGRDASRRLAASRTQGVDRARGERPASPGPGPSDSDPGQLATLQQTKS